MSAALAKLATAKLADIVPHLELAEDVSAALSGCAGAQDALDMLVGRDMLLEAVKLLGHAMPRREGVWWACMCARHTGTAESKPVDLAALEAAELWVRRPTEENRRAAYAAANAAQFQTPEAWAAAAVFFSGGSVSLPDLPPVEPAPHLAGLAVAGSVHLASVRGDVARQKGRLALFVGSAREIAAGGTGRLAQESV